MLKVRSRIMLSLIILSMPLICRSAPSITWQPQHLTKDLIAGTAYTTDVSFVSAERLTNVRIVPVPALARIVDVSPSYFSAIEPGEPQHLIIAVVLPDATTPTTLLGTIHIVDSSDTSRTYAAPLSVSLNVNVPTLTFIPPGPALPSPDRVLNDPQAESVFFVKDELLLFVKPGTTVATVSQIISGINGSFIGSIAIANCYQIKLPQGGMSNLMVAIDKLRDVADLMLAIPHFLLSSTASLSPNDPGTVSSYAPSLIRLFNAWSITTGSKTVGSGDALRMLKIGVVDGVFDNEHADLKANISKPAQNSMPSSFNPHGTRVASIIGAREATIRMALPV